MYIFKICFINEKKKFSTVREIEGAGAGLWFPNFDKKFD